jgi:hypothetical protein
MLARGRGADAAQAGDVVEERDGAFEEIGDFGGQ